MEKYRNRHSRNPDKRTGCVIVDKHGRITIYLPDGRAVTEGTPLPKKYRHLRSLAAKARRKHTKRLTSTRQPDKRKMCDKHP